MISKNAPKKNAYTAVYALKFHCTGGDLGDNGGDDECKHTKNGIKCSRFAKRFLMK